MPTSMSIRKEVGSLDLSYLNMLFCTGEWLKVYPSLYMCIYQNSTLRYGRLI